eukprot:5076425-Heterocapsa_arctica.AAC.1
MLLFCVSGLCVRIRSRAWASTRFAPSIAIRDINSRVRADRRPAPGRCQKIVAQARRHVISVQVKRQHAAGSTRELERQH